MVAALVWWSKSPWLRLGYLESIDASAMTFLAMATASTIFRASKSETIGRPVVPVWEAMCEAITQGGCGMTIVDVVLVTIVARFATLG